MSHRQTLSDHIPEGTTRFLPWTFLDEDGEGVSPDSILLTLYDKKTNAIVNERSKQNVLNANGGVLAAGGAFTLRLDPADNALPASTPKGRGVPRIALIEWTWGADERKDKAEIEFVVVNLEHVP